MLTPPLPEPATRELLDCFHRDGFAIVRGVLSREECDYFKKRTDDLADDPIIKETNKHGAYSFVISNPLEHDRAFAELFIREPILSLVRGILGPECRFCGQNVIRNKPGQAVSFWHVDDLNLVDYPLPADIPRWPAGARMPVLWLSVQMALTDILVSTDGPTEVVRGSHYSGRLPPAENPVFEGRGAEPVFCQAGDIYLFNHQVWHRGRPNESQRTRYLMQLQYARGDRFAYRTQGAIPTPRLDKILEDVSPALRDIFYGPAKYT